MITNLELHTKLSNIFHIGFNFITAENTLKPRWRTNRKYRLTRGEFVKRYSDELNLLGVSFGTTTRYFMLDIDRGSQYHPDNDSKAYQKLLQLLEQIGIVRVDLIRSSHSQGIHIYGCLPKSVSTIRLATLLHVTFIDAGIKISKGQLECFPNPKPYGEKGYFTYYNPHRLPLQPNSGSLLLDEDGEILLNAENLTHESMVAGFLARTALSAQAQDMVLLNRLMDTCYAKYTSNKGIAKYQQHHKDYTEVAREWKENLELTIQTIGWTDYGQTNTLLPNFIAYGVVFLGLKGEELKNCLHELIQLAPGYHQYCRHKHEIKSVIKDWVENTERQGYYVEYCGFPARSGLNPHLTVKRIKATRSNQHNSDLAKRTEQRLNAILTALTEIPDRVGAKIAAIRTKSIELFGEAISRNTLYKPAYKPLWLGVEEIAKLEKDPTPPANSLLTVVQSQLQPITLENNILTLPAQTQSESKLSYTPPLYETYVGQIQNSWLHHQLQLFCINLLCESILDLQQLSSEFVVETELQSTLLNLPNSFSSNPNPQPISTTLEIQNSPIQNIHSTNDLDYNDPQFEEIVMVSNESEGNLDLHSPVDLEPDSDPVYPIQIGTKLRRNMQQIGRITYSELVNCQVVSTNGLDWVVRDFEGCSWNVSYHALSSGAWEIEPDFPVVVDLGGRSVVEIAAQMRGNLAAISDALLLEFLHHPELEAIQALVELANEVANADASQLVVALVADLSPRQKLDLWEVLSVDERAAVKLQFKIPAAPSSYEVKEAAVGTLVTTLTGLVGTIRHVFKSVAKPFVVYHEELNRTICYQDSELRFTTD